MSIGAEPRADATMRPRGRSFELTLRGYDKRQVDRHLEQLDGQIAMLSGEHGRSAVRVRELTAEVQRLRAELAELQEQPVQADRATFQDLGADGRGDPDARRGSRLASSPSRPPIGPTSCAASPSGSSPTTRERAAQARQDLAEELAARLGRAGAGARGAAQPWPRPN